MEYFNISREKKKGGGNPSSYLNSKRYQTLLDVVMSPTAGLQHPMDVRDAGPRTRIDGGSRDVGSLQDRDCGSGSELCCQPQHPPPRPHILHLLPSNLLPSERLSTGLVMTVLQTAVLSPGALLETRFNSALRKEKKTEGKRQSRGAVVFFFFF